jgi:hypothetical protein
MPKRSSRKPQQDINQLAAAILGAATSEKPRLQTETLAKNPAAVTLGRLGGLRGGNARAAKLSAKKRTEIAKKAADARWAKKL